MIFYNKYKKFRIENNIDLKDISKRTKTPNSIFIVYVLKAYVLVSASTDAAQPQRMVADLQ